MDEELTMRIMIRIRSSFSLTKETTKTGSKKETPKGYRISPTKEPIGRLNSVSTFSGKIFSIQLHLVCVIRLHQIRQKERKKERNNKEKRQIKS